MGLCARDLRGRGASRTQGSPLRATNSKMVFGARPWWRGARWALVVCAAAVVGLSVVAGAAQGDAAGGDGQYSIAFASTGSHAPESGNVLVEAGDGSGQRALTTDGHQDAFPTWSPDGRRLAYVESYDTHPAVWLVNRDGSGAHLLVAGSAPVWSPDGGRIAFESDEGALDTIRPDGTGTVQVDPGASNGGVFHGCPAWSPDGSMLASFYQSFEDTSGHVTEEFRDEIRVVRSDGTGVVGAHNGDQSCPSWSSDSHWIAISGPSSAQGSQYARDIQVMRPDASGLHEIASDRCALDGDPVWSHDGSRLAFSRFPLTQSSPSPLPTLSPPPPPCPASLRGLWTTSPDGTAIRQIAAISSASQYVWSVDDTRIAFVNAYVTGQNCTGCNFADIYLVRPDGTDLHRLPRGDSGSDRINTDPAFAPPVAAPPNASPPSFGGSPSPGAPTGQPSGANAIGLPQSAEQSTSASTSSTAVPVSPLAAGHTPAGVTHASTGSSRHGAVLIALAALVVLLGAAVVTVLKMRRRSVTGQRPA